jgi:lipopolysaccharide transport system permease protein
MTSIDRTRQNTNDGKDGVSTVMRVQSESLYPGNGVETEPAQNLWDHLNELAASGALLRVWTWRIVRARYQQSILGGLWAILQPAATVAIFTLVFTRFIHVDTGGIPYALFSFATVVPWALLSTSLTDMVSCLVDNMNLVTKIYFPREVLPIAALLARMLDFGIAFCVLLALMAFYGIPFFTTVWLYLPLVLIIQAMLILGLGLIGSALNVFYRDIKHLVGLALQIWLYASPVIYPASAVPEGLRPFYRLNPMTGICESYRRILLYGQPPDSSFLISTCIAILSAAFGYWFFKRVDRTFADLI